MSKILGTISSVILSGSLVILAACGGGGTKPSPPPPNPVSPAITVTPSPASPTTVQSVTVTVAASGSAGTVTGSVTLTSGTYTSAATALAGGSASITIDAGKLATGANTLTASYTPDSAGSQVYKSASGTGTVTVTKATPTVTATPSAAQITPSQALSVAVTVSGGTGAPAATGTVTLTSGGYTSGAATLASGGATINIPAGSLANGNNTLSVAYTPDTAGAAIYNSGSATAAVSVGTVTPVVTVTPASSTINTQQALDVTVAVAGGTGNPTPTGSVVLAGGGFTSSAATLANGSATVHIPAASLVAGTVALSATYTPDTAGATTYATATGNSNVTVTKITPTVTVTPATTTINTAQDLQVTVAVTVPAGDATPTGSAKVTSGAYTSSSATLSSGSASITIPAGSLAAGSNTLTANYTPDGTSSPIYSGAAGTSPSVSVVQVSRVTIDQASVGPKVSEQLLGMNMAAWADPTASFVVPAFQAAGIKALRWPGGSWSDIYHWQTNSTCQGTPPALTPGGWAHPNAVFVNIINDLQIPAGMDLSLTANYGTDGTCTKGGDPQEAADWITYAEAHGGTVSRMTVGNENYGNWETDLHAKPNDAATYATAAATGYYPAIKAVDHNVMVGVVVNPGNSPDWDTTVLSQALYDFVEYHFYPQGPNLESDTYLVQKAAQDLTKNIKTVKSELNTAGKPNTPIFVGEIGSVYTNPGKQSWSITQGLYAGQALGEMMNEGVSRLTWWIGFGNCNGTSGNDSASLYGWQNFGAYNVFADGDSNCPYGGPGGTMSPTARAFQLFSNIAVNGESVLTAAVAGDTTDVRAYAATHSGGTALFLFNLNQTTSQSVQVKLSAANTSSGVQVITYGKALYDQSKTNVWADPTTTDMGSQSLPLTLTLEPWSMNVVIIK